LGLGAIPAFITFWPRLGMHETKAFVEVIHSVLCGKRNECPRLTFNLLGVPTAGAKEK
jgi:hypothetical protein